MDSLAGVRVEEDVLPQASAACVENQPLLFAVASFTRVIEWKKKLCSSELNHPWGDARITHTLYATNYSAAWRFGMYKADLRNTLRVGGLPEHTCCNQVTTLRGSQAAPLMCDWQSLGKLVWECCAVLNSVRWLLQQKFVHLTDISL